MKRERPTATGVNIRFCRLIVLEKRDYRKAIRHLCIEVHPFDELSRRREREILAYFKEVEAGDSPGIVDAD